MLPVLLTQIYFDSTEKNSKPNLQEGPKCTPVKYHTYPTLLPEKNRKALNAYKHKHTITSHHIPLIEPAISRCTVHCPVSQTFFTHNYTNKGVARLGYPTSCGLLILMYKHVVFCACRVILPRKSAREPNQTLLAAATGF